MKYEIIILTPSKLISFEGKIIQVLKTEFLGDYPIKLYCLVEKDTKNK